MKSAILIIAIVALAQVAFAEGPCAVQRKDCQGNKKLTYGHGLWKCIEEEAQAANNTACLTMLKKNKGGPHGEGSASAPAAAPAN